MFILTRPSQLIYVYCAPRQLSFMWRLFLFNLIVHISKCDYSPGVFELGLVSISPLSGSWIEVQVNITVNLRF
jgi:hypothetical protein